MTMVNQIRREEIGYRNAYTGVAQGGGGSGFSNWWDDHFTAQASGEISKGVQISLGLEKGANFNANLVSQTLLEGAWGNQEKYVRSYTEKPFAYMDKGKALDFGGSYYAGGNYNWNIVNGKRVSQTFSAGAFGGLIAGDYTWGKGGSKLFLGINVSGKVAVGWGASGGVKLGFIWDW
ncbi:hypothetical protein QA597_11885, partial [Marinilabiliaceae bacterium ANBcel2]|nr:hypothetical protein [Marinilabiliaceae bacterium ANBcel2]